MSLQLSAQQALPSDVCLLYLVRHGATQNNLEQPPRLQGRRSNLPLSTEGREQAVRLGRFLAEVELAAVYSSPLLRAVSTAEEIARPHDLECRTLPELIEADVGDWEGRSWVEIARAEPDAYQRFISDPGECGYAGGESFRQVAERTLPVFNGLLRDHRGQRIAVVTHNVVNRVFLGTLWGIPLAHARRILQDNGGLNLIRHEAAQTRIITVNATFHLE
jgi:broad specificity phosphatase PhoE